jgi:hypothetical protein
MRVMTVIQFTLQRPSMCWRDVYGFASDRTIGALVQALSRAAL